MATDLGVLHDVKFTFGKDSAGFIQYMDDEAKTNQQVAESLFGGYLDYMDNPLKASGLFDAQCNYLTQEERQAYVEKFKIGQQNDSILWQDLFSFRNEWLQEYGLMDPKTNEVDDKRLMNAVKAAMDVLIQSEGYQNYAWIGAMHHNTDNRHFHVAGVELTPSRLWKWHGVYKKDYRGRYLYDENGRKIPTGNKVYEPTGSRKKATLAKMKRVFVNQLIQSAESLKVIDQLARQEIIGAIKNPSILQSPVKEERQLLADIYLKLPRDKRLWNMKNARKQFFGKEVDRFVAFKLKGEVASPYQKWEQLVTKLGDEYERAYNKIEVEGAEAITKSPYYKNKLAELYYDGGNAVISQLKVMDKLREKEGVNRKKWLENWLHIPHVENKDHSAVEKTLRNYEKEVKRRQKATSKDAPITEATFKQMKGDKETQLDYWFEKGLTREPDLLQKGGKTSPYSDLDIDTSLFGLDGKYRIVDGRSEKEPENRQSNLLQKGNSSKAPLFKVVNVYLEDTKIRTLVSQEVERIDVQKKMEREFTTAEKKLYRGSQDRSQFFSDRRRDATLNRTLKNIDYKMKQASEKWRNELDYERLEAQILQESLSRS